MTSVYVIAIANIYFYGDNMKRKTVMDDFKQVAQILKTTVNTIKSYCQRVKIVYLKGKIAIVTAVHQNEMIE